MKFVHLVKILLATASLVGLSAHASLITYTYTAANSHYGDFTYDDTASSVGAGPFASGGVAYNAVSFNFDGVSIANPMLLIYQNFGGNQWAYFTNSGGNTYVQLGVVGTGLFASSAASEMNGRVLADFTYPNENVLSNGSALLTLSSTSNSVPEPESLALVGLGLLAVTFMRRKTNKQS